MSQPIARNFFLLSLIPHEMSFNWTKPWNGWLCHSFKIGIAECDGIYFWLVTPWKRRFLPSFSPASNECLQVYSIRGSFGAMCNSLGISIKSCISLCFWKLKSNISWEKVFLSLIYHQGETSTTEVEFSRKSAEKQRWLERNNEQTSFGEHWEREGKKLYLFFFSPLPLFFPHFRRKWNIFAVALNQKYFRVRSENEWRIHSGFVGYHGYMIFVYELDCRVMRK